MPEYQCLIETCKNKNPQFSLPKESNRRRRFLEILGISTYKEGRRLCRNHFWEKDIKMGKGGREFLRKGALPKKEQSSPSPTSIPFPADLTWRCKDRDLRCHKVVLAAHSQLLKRSFDETCDMIITPDIEASVIEVILLLLYKGQAFPSTKQTIEIEEALKCLGFVDISLKLGCPEAGDTMVFSKEAIDPTALKFDDEGNLVQMETRTSGPIGSYLSKLSTVIHEDKKDFQSIAIQCGQEFLKKSYTKEEYIIATKIYFYSPNCYRYLRSEGLLKLPCKLSINKKFSSFEFKPGLDNTEAFSLLSSKMASLEENERNCVLVFDDMKLKEEYKYCNRLRYLFPPSAQATCFLIRGITAPFKQIINYDFGLKVNKKLIESVIMKCEEAGAHVRAICCDMGNKTLLSELNIHQGSYYFENPSPKRKSERCYVICDMIHCYKNLRNHILDYGIRCYFEDDEVVTLDKTDFVKVLEKDGALGELRMAYKITDLHLECQGNERQRTYLACQLLSGTIGNLFKKFNLSGKARILHTVNNAFDTLDSKHMYTKDNILKCGFGTNLIPQLEALEAMEHLLLHMEFRVKKGSAVYTETMKPFQHGFLATINSTKSLFYELAGEDQKYLLTARLNQDCIENLFSAVRRQEGPNGNHPNAPEFARRVRKLAITGNISECISDSNCNVQLEAKESDEPYCVPDQSFLQSINITEKMPELIQKSNVVDPHDDDDYKYCIDAVKYVSGWICRRLGLLSVDPTPGGWIYLQSRVNLQQACPEVFEKVKLCNKYFNELHGFGSSIKTGKDILSRTVDHIIARTGIQQRDIVKKFVNCKFFMRIKAKNQQMQKTKKLKARAKGKKVKSVRSHTKLGHFTN